VTGDQLVTDYLARLERAAQVLPDPRRRDLVDEVRGHIELALDAAGARDEVAVRNALERVGDPEEIVAAEGEMTGTGRSHATTRADSSGRRAGLGAVSARRTSPVILTLLTVAVVVLIALAAVPETRVPLALASLLIVPVAILLYIIFAMRRPRQP
jgi:uncharacterized membrane protein